jgi:hypothetical protein
LPHAGAPARSHSGYAAFIAGGRVAGNPNSVRDRNFAGVASGIVEGVESAGEWFISLGMVVSPWLNNL